MANHLRFGDFRLDPTNECLWEGERAIALRPKAYAVLKHLVDHRGQLVTEQQLLDAVWPGTFVTDAVLKASIRQLREALADDADSPRYIDPHIAEAIALSERQRMRPSRRRLGSSGLLSLCQP